MTQDYFEKEWEDPLTNPIDTHLPDIAGKFRKLKTTDAEPVSVIVDKLKQLDHIQAVDIGCGAARYDILLYRYLGNKLKLTCLDADADMLKNLSTYLARHNVRNFSSRNSSAQTMPFPDDSLDCVFTFNAIRSFSLPRFFTESARAMKNGGYLFVYMSLREKDDESTSPPPSLEGSAEETPLNTLQVMKESIDNIDGIAIETIIFFAYNKMAALEQMVLPDEPHRGSDFVLYTPEELKKAVSIFNMNLDNVFEDASDARSYDENVLFIIKKGL